MRERIKRSFQVRRQMENKKLVRATRNKQLGIKVVFTERNKRLLCRTSAKHKRNYQGFLQMEP